MNINVKDARQPRCSAEKRDRFIPCRGGGTATTYYSDVHDVDEDNRAICTYNGWYNAGDWAGVTYRHLIDTPTLPSGVVASRLIYLS